MQAPGCMLFDGDDAAIDNVEKFANDFRCIEAIEGGGVATTNLQ